MADLREVLPGLDLKPWRHLTYSLEKKNVTTAELISLDPIEIARKCPLPLKEVGRMAAAVTRALQVDLGLLGKVSPARTQVDGEEPPRKKVKLEAKPIHEVEYVKILDQRIDDALGGGFPTGSISEIVGESAAGKTQFVLSLLLSAQLSPPYGPARGALYLSTEDNLNTPRLHQMIESHPLYNAMDPKYRPSLDSIVTMNLHDLEKQELIMDNILAQAVKQFDLGLVVVDSVAANFRIEFQGASKKVLTQRAVALVKLGKILRKIAHDDNVAVVVTNQVSDRFDDERTLLEKDRFRSTQSQGSSSQVTQKQTSVTPGPPNRAMPPPQRTSVPTPTQGSTQKPPAPTAHQRRDEVMSLDFQQRFFTGWGDDPYASPFEQLKTPALGLTWANQIDARVVLKIGQEGRSRPSDTGHIWSDAKRRRYLRVVFAPWVAGGRGGREGVEYELRMQGPVSVAAKDGKHEDVEDFDDFDAGALDKEEDLAEHTEFLDPKYWENLDDEDFP